MIVFEGNDLVVHFQDGETDYLLITFACARETKVATQTFFAESVAKKNNITCIGVTTKEDFWYCSPEKEDVIKKIQEFSKYYKKIIVTGTSMGGYAALAWSRALNADTVLACSPQWSLDPVECEVQQEYLDNNFRDGMQGMGIRAHQTKGRILIAFDPIDVWDTYYALKIHEHVPNISFIKTYYSGHLVMGSLSGTKEFGAIINALAYSNISEIREIITQIRRKSERNLLKKCQLNLEKHPYLVQKLLVSESMRKLKRKERLFEDQIILCRNIYFLISRNFVKEAITLYKLSKNANYLKNFDAVDSENCIYTNYYLISVHGYKIGYNLKHSVINGQDLLLPRAETLPIIARKTKEKIALCVEIDGEFLYISFKDGKLSLKNSPYSDDIFYMEPSKNTKGSFYLAVSEAGYLVTNPNRECGLFSQNDDQWERLTLLPITV